MERRRTAGRLQSALAIGQSRIARSDPIIGLPMTMQPDYALLTIFAAVLLPLIVLAAVSFWIPGRLRFSTRSLLIVMTLLAVLLGFAVWAARN